MKPIKPVYLKRSNKNERMAVLVFLLVIALVILFSGMASAQANDRNSYIHEAGVVSNADSGNNTTIIKWNIAPDTRYRFFLIERSQDRVHYEFVSVLRITGNVNSTNFYSVTDYNPLTGTTYYRVSETDFKAKPMHLFELKYSNAQSLTKN